MSLPHPALSPTTLDSVSSVIRFDNRFREQKCEYAMNVTHCPCIIGSVALLLVSMPMLCLKGRPELPQGCTSEAGLQHVRGQIHASKEHWNNTIHIYPASMQTNQQKLQNVGQKKANQQSNKKCSAKQMHPLENLECWTKLGAQLSNKFGQSEAQISDFEFNYKFKCECIRLRAAFRSSIHQTATLTWTFVSFDRAKARYIDFCEHHHTCILKQPSLHRQQETWKGVAWMCVLDSQLVWLPKDHQ